MALLLEQLPKLTGKMKEQNKPDPFGEAVSDYYSSKWKASKIQVESSITSGEKISPSYLFRRYKKMPEIEQFALDACEGRILDVGACAGSHALYLQYKQKEVKAIDISPLCCSTMEARGVQDVECVDFYQFRAGNQKFDTILLLMNGIGIAGSLSNLGKFLGKLKDLLAAGGKVLFDSSDIDYAYYEKDGSKWVNLNSEYYGEVIYSLIYKKTRGNKFPWLFVDAQTISKYAEENGFQFKLLKEGSHYDYLGELTLIK